MTRMSMATSSLMSTKYDYTSLKELNKSTDDIVESLNTSKDK